MITVKDLRLGREKSKEVADRDEWLKAEEIQVTIKRAALLDYLSKILNKD